MWSKQASNYIGYYQDPDATCHCHVCCINVSIVPSSQAVARWLIVGRVFCRAAVLSSSDSVIIVLAYAAYIRRDSNKYVQTTWILYSQLCQIDYRPIFTLFFHRNTLHKLATKYSDPRFYQTRNASLHYLVKYRCRKRDVKRTLWPRYLSSKERGAAASLLIPVDHR